MCMRNSGCGGFLEEVEGFEMRDLSHYEVIRVLPSIAKKTRCDEFAALCTLSALGYRLPFGNKLHI